MSSSGAEAGAEPPPRPPRTASLAAAETTGAAEDSAGEAPPPLMPRRASATTTDAPPPIPQRQHSSTTDAPRSDSASPATANSSSGSSGSSEEESSDSYYDRVEMATPSTRDSAALPEGATFTIAADPNKKKKKKKKKKKEKAKSEVGHQEDGESGGESGGQAAADEEEADLYDTVESSAAPPPPVPKRSRAKSEPEQVHGAVAKAEHDPSSQSVSPPPQTKPRSATTSSSASSTVASASAAAATAAGCNLTELPVCTAKDENEPQSVPLDHEALNSIGWFHGPLSRHVANTLLMENGIDGTFLLRETENETDVLVLGVRSAGAVAHFRVEFDGQSYTLGQRTFPDLAAFCTHVEGHPTIGTHNQLRTTLHFPYPRTVDDFRNYETVRIHTEWGHKQARGGPRNTDLSALAKEGYLTKRGAIKKNWKGRYFVLYKNELKYYKRQGDAKPIRVIDLTKCLEVKPDASYGKQHCFSIRLPERTFAMFAESEKIASEWVEVLQWKVARLNPAAAAAAPAATAPAAASAPTPADAHGEGDGTAASPPSSAPTSGETDADVDADDESEGAAGGADARSPTL